MSNISRFKISKIIIEGQDRCGKDTLINNIIKEYKIPFQVLHYYANRGKDYKTFGSDLYNNMFDIFHQQQFVIANRAHLGEKVYGPLYRKQNGDYIDSIEKKFNTKSILLIVLVDEPENLIARDDGDSHSIDSDLKLKEKELFTKAYEDSTIKEKMIININNLDEDQVKAKVFKKMNEMEQWR
jgi:thymidylate kinase